MTSDFLLLQKIRNGNNHAGNQFVEKYYSFIYQYCFLHIHNQECAEDMVQETFVRFFGALMSGAEIGKAKSYLYSIAGNIIKNYYKKKKEILLDQLPDIEKDNLSEIEIRIDVERALDLLPEEIKETAILFFFQGLKQKEISDLLHIKLSLVKYRVSKAKELLSKQLEEGLKQYQRKIKEYKSLIQKEYIQETAVCTVMERCSDIVSRQDNRRASYFEFLFEQFKFIKKRWWALQGGILFLLWILLTDSDGGANTERTLGAMSVMFSVMIVPEIWKNRRFSAVEIEKTAFYSLRQICAARTLLFAAVDLVMITAFFSISVYTLQISAYRLIIDFLVPFNVSCCICFRLLYSKWNDMEYIAVFLSIACILIWTLIVSTDSIYQRISMPIWVGLLIISFGYLIFYVHKSQCNCEINWEVKSSGTAI